MALAPTVSTAVQQLMRHSHLAAIACRAPVVYRARRQQSLLSSRTFSTRVATNPWLTDDALRHTSTIMQMWRERSQRKHQLKAEREHVHKGRERECFHFSPCGHRLRDVQRRHSRKSDEMLNHIQKLVEFMERFKIDNHVDSGVTKGHEKESAKHPSDSTADDLHITTYKSGLVASSTRIPRNVIGVGAKMMSLLHADAAGIADVVKRAQGMHVRGIVFEHEHPDDDFKVIVSVGEPCDRTGSEVEPSIKADLKIRSFNVDSCNPHGVTTVSGNILAIADKIIPEDARSAMKAKGVILDEIVKFATDANARGVTILEHIDVEHGQRVVISLE